MLKIKDNVDLKEILEKFNKEVEKAELTRNPYSNEDKKFKHILVSLSEERFNIFKDTLDYITNLQEKINQYENPDDMTLFYMWLDTKAKDKIKELQEYKKVVQMEYKREYAKRYLEERRKEQPNLLYPDSDEIYKRYYELKEENERYKKIFEGKEKFSKIMPDDIDFIIMSKADYDRQLDDIELVAQELKSRNEKAIEYIEKCRDYHKTYHKEEKIFSDEITILLMILQGEDKDGNDFINR